MSVAIQASAERTIAPPGRWTVDARQSAILFTAEHLTTTPVTGGFREFEGALEVDRDGDVRAHGAVKVESLDTGMLERDLRLLSPDFLDVDRYPEIRYQLLAFRPTGHSGYRMLGELDLRGVTGQLMLHGTVHDPVQGAWGEELLALELGGELSLQDYGLRLNELVDSNSVVGDTVRFGVNLSLVRRGEWVA